MMKQNNLFKDNIIELSVAGLSKEFMVDDAQRFISEFRSNFLKNVREKNGVSKEELSRKLRISIEELDKIEDGRVNEKHIMALSKISEFFDIDYQALLYMFKLVKRYSREESLKMAACHDQKIDEETQKMLLEFVNRLQGM